MGPTEMSDVFQNQQLLNLAEQPQLPLLADLNEIGQKAFRDAPFPTRKQETWKYTSLKRLLDQPYTAAVTPQAVTPEHLAGLIPDTQGGVRLVCVDGVLNTELSDGEALRLMTPFSMASAEQQQTIQTYLGKTQAASRNDNFLLSLNDAAIRDGVLIHVDANQKLDSVLHVVHVTTEQESQVAYHQRLLIVVDRHAEATVAEYYVSAGDSDQSLTTTTTDIHIGANAALTHYRLNTQQEDALFFGGCFVDLMRDARYHGFHLGLGTQVNRHDIRVEHREGGSHCDLNGVYVPQNRQLVDFHTAIEHGVAHCTSEEDFRGIMNDKSKAVFNGRIHIHPDAQKTLAEMSNKNLLLTNTAEVNTKPELEIYADDVRCAHGATVAQLDEQALFYLTSRGIAKAEAEVMLSFGFINELIEALSNECISNWLRPILAYRFGRDQSLAQHLVG